VEEILRKRPECTLPLPLLSREGNKNHIGPLPSRERKRERGDILILMNSSTRERR
jgi:hypothetical protein